MQVNSNQSADSPYTSKTQGAPPKVEDRPGHTSTKGSYAGDMHKATLRKAEAATEQNLLSWVGDIFNKLKGAIPGSGSVFNGRTTDDSNKG